jgi:TRAP transporter 4TM/12TM fusion protein
MPGGPEATDQARPSERVDELVARHEQESAARRLSGRLAGCVGAVAMGLAAYVLYSVFRPQPAPQYRMTFLAVVLPLTFLVYRPGRGGGRAVDTPAPGDWVLAGASLVVCVYPLVVFDDLIRRTVTPTTADVVIGWSTVALVLEATRRTVGRTLPLFCLGFLAYAYYGGYLPDWAVAHRGYGPERLVAQLYMGTEGIYGVPLDVAATYIVLFAIYGAVLDHSGASRFFMDLSFAAFRRSRTAPGRTVTLAGFLLGSVSGSGVATTVSLGSASWPILRRAGYPPDQAGGVLAAAGIGAILSPPTLGAAAFIIAELLEVTYLKVVVYALVPTLLYYLGILLAIEIDARRFGVHPVDVDLPSPWRLLARFGYHFSSLVVIVALMALGQSPFKAVVYATVLALALSFLDPARRLGPARAAKAVAAGVHGVLPVASTTAAAGIIVGVVTLTGLGLNASSLIVDMAEGNLAITAVLSALAVMVLGLAVPVTASFIMAAAIVGPALIDLLAEGGVAGELSRATAYMFIFYYAVLSEVSPPTALAAVAAAAITGGSAFRTMLMAWKYTLPAFLVPFALVLAPAGTALLGQAPAGEIVVATAISAVAVATLAVATGGWLVHRAAPAERLLCGAAALLLLYLRPDTTVVGLAAATTALVLHLRRTRRRSPAGDRPPTRTSSRRTSGQRPG